MKEAPCKFSKPVSTTPLPSIVVCTSSVHYVPVQLSEAGGASLGDSFSRLRGEVGRSLLEIREMCASRSNLATNVGKEQIRLD